VKRIYVIPRVAGVGGMVSFQTKFSTGLESRGYEIRQRLSNISQQDSILVIGGTRDILTLWRAKKRGARIVQRLNGMNWIHRVRPTGFKHYLRAEYGNLILRIIRSRLADHIVYQSKFAKNWWERTYGLTPVSNTIVYNAVDLEIYSPNNLAPNSSETTQYKLPAECYRVLLVEGALMGGYELGLESAVKLTELLNREYRNQLEKPIELMIAGRVADEVKNRWSQSTQISLKWVGLIPPEKIPALDRSAHLLYSSDINAACPNSVIEALACGLPVLAFDTGALPELITGDAGRVVAYGGDPWQLESPDIPALAEAAVEILTQQRDFRPAARTWAEESFKLDLMIDHYLQVLKG
jgi:glycosyltransferase involved in cell wall biosynthesis